MFKHLNYQPNNLFALRSQIYNCNTSSVELSCLKLNKTQNCSVQIKLEESVKLKQTNRFKVSNLLKHSKIKITILKKQITKLIMTIKIFICATNFLTKKTSTVERR